jgi:hypothetical protein
MKQVTDPLALPNAGSALFSEPLLVVRQKPEIVDSTPMYAILDQNGTRVGSVAYVGERDMNRVRRPGQLPRQAPAGSGSRARGFMAALKTLSSIAELRHRVEVRDEAGVAVLALTSAEFSPFSPSAGSWQEPITVAREDGITIGHDTQETTLRKPRYILEADGQWAGTIVADQWWTVHHHVLDAQDREVARFAPQRRGWFARTVDREPPSLLLAGTLTADTVLTRVEPQGPSANSS